MNATPALTLERLREHQLLDAWPLIGLAMAYPVRDWWTHEAAELLRQGGGVLVARRPDGLVHGLATYRRSSPSKEQHILTVTHLITVELSRKQPVRQALLRALDALAIELRCSSMALPLPR